MKAFVITGPGRADVADVPDPLALPGEVVVDVARAGVCGTDLEFWSGQMPYLAEGLATYPIRIGHEWCGTVTSVGTGVDPEWLGCRVTGDTMLGCGLCRRCRTGYHHVCELRTELGVRGGHPGALAERLSVPASSLVRLPREVDDVMGALVEPGGNAHRAVQAARVGSGERLLVTGPGTIGLLVGLFARASGAEVHLLGNSQTSIDFARGLGFANVWTESDLPEVPWDAVVDASNATSLPARALELVEPGKRVVYVGLASAPSLIDTRTLALKDVTAVGVLGASAGLRGTVEAFASGQVDPRPLVAATVAMDTLPDILAGTRPVGAGDGPKFHVAIT